MGESGASGFLAEGVTSYYLPASKSLVGHLVTGGALECSGLRNKVDEEFKYLGQDIIKRSSNTYENRLSTFNTQKNNISKYDIYSDMMDYPGKYLKKK